MAMTKKKIISLIVIPVIAVGSFLAGHLYSRSTGGGELILQESAWDTEGDLSAMPSGTVAISPQKQQLIGIRMGRVEAKPITRTIRLLGKVAADETRIYYIDATVDGWITQTFANTTGSLVKKDETLAAFYSPEFLSASQAVLYALGSKDRIRSRNNPNRGRQDQIAQFDVNLQQYKDSLRNLGMGDLQIQEMIETRKYMENINITAPADGFILVRNVSPGYRFEKGTELYRLADLSRVWILADVYEREAECFQPGVEAQVILPYRKQTYVATVSEVLPVFDAVSRTLKVRLETDNPGFILRPDMFADVELPVTYPPMVSVPEDAILDSGFKKTVFVYRGNGFFEPREVETDRHIGDRVEIVKGLEAGEEIVISGNFLIDSESKLELAASGMYETLSKDPVSGLDVSVNKALKGGMKSSFKGKTYYFSSGESKAQFEKDPEQYIQEE